MNKLVNELMDSDELGGGAMSVDRDRLRFMAVLCTLGQGCCARQSNCPGRRDQLAW